MGAFSEFHVCLSDFMGELASLSTEVDLPCIMLFRKLTSSDGERA